MPARDAEPWLLALRNTLRTSVGRAYRIYAVGKKTKVDIKFADGSRGSAKLDIPLLLRQYDALERDDEGALFSWNDWLLANRETAELYLEDSQQGGALLRLLKSLAVPAALEWPQGEPIALMTALAMAGQHWQTGARALALGALWSWLENQTGAATKLIPLGQTDAQRLLDRMLPDLPAVVDIAVTLSADDLGAGLPGLAFASARHEHQYTRLFRS